MLLERGANTESRSSHGDTALHHAAMVNSGGEATLLLLRYGADVDAGLADDVGTPLHLAAAASNHSVIIIQHLLQHGANPDVRTKDGVSALDLATRNGGEKAVQMLIEGGADVEAADDEGLTPLDIAIQENQESIAQLLRDQYSFLHRWRKSGGYN